MVMKSASFPIVARPFIISGQFLKNYYDPSSIKEELSEVNTVKSLISEYSKNPQVN
jgi:hypothetical protein